ncbi:MAG TPA: DUF1540 domain-containing protein [Desulfuromonadales bacterium]|nr:DUF1540 domain-containing protein [Desulfuromonadales bacterium]
MPKTMSPVKDCAVSSCAYNEKKACHAMAITVGASTEPMCGTYFQSSSHGGVKDMTGGVGACKVADCRFNESFECSAPDIHVGLKHNHPDCLTFETRM